MSAGIHQRALRPDGDHDPAEGDNVGPEVRGDGRRIYENNERGSSNFDFIAAGNEVPQSPQNAPERAIEGNGVDRNWMRDNHGFFDSCLFFGIFRTECD